MSVSRYVATLGFCGMAFSLFAGSSSFLVYRWSVHQHLPRLAAALIFQHPPTCARAASACGSQKVMAMSRYSAMAMVSAARWLWAAHLDVEGAQAQVAVCLQGTHAQFLSQSESLAVVGLGRLALRRFTMRRNCAEEAQGISLVAAFLVFTSMR